MVQVNLCLLSTLGNIIKEKNLTDENGEQKIKQIFKDQERECYKPSNINQHL